MPRAGHLRVCTMPRDREPRLRRGDISYDYPSHRWVTKSSPTAAARYPTGAVQRPYNRARRSVKLGCELERPVSSSASARFTPSAFLAVQPVAEPAVRVSFSFTRRSRYRTRSRGNGSPTGFVSNRSSAPEPFFRRESRANRCPPAMSQGFSLNPIASFPLASRARPRTWPTAFCARASSDDRAVARVSREAILGIRGSPPPRLTD